VFDSDDSGGAKLPPITEGGEDEGCPQTC